MFKKKVKLLVGIVVTACVMQSVSGTMTVMAADVNEEIMEYETESEEVDEVEYAIESEKVNESEETDSEMENVAMFSLSEVLLRDGEIYVEKGAMLETVKAALANALVENIDEIDASELNWEYYCTGSTTLGATSTEWVSIEGATKKSGLKTYKFSSLSENTEGSFKIRVAGFSDEVTVTRYYGKDSSISLKETEEAYQVSIAFNDDLGYDLNGIKENIWNQVVESTDPELNAADVTFEYYSTPSASSPLGEVDANAFKNWVPFEGKELKIGVVNCGFPAIGAGEHQVRISFGGNNIYKATSVEFKVNIIDNRIESSVVAKESSSITYNMEAAVMNYNLFANVIDLEQSVLPEVINADEFVIEYYATANISSALGSVDVTKQDWVPVAGTSTTLAGVTYAYPQMGAGQQQVRISFKGNKEYRPSVVETIVNVKKADVKVSVKPFSIFFDEQIPENVIVTNPEDKFNNYVIYAGITNNITTSVNIVLPEKFYNESVIKSIDAAIIASGLTDKTLSGMLQKGVTVGELKEILLNEDLMNVVLGSVDLVNKVHDTGINTDAIRLFVDIINQLPSITDNLRIAFEKPSNAGAYSIYVVSTNDNYNNGYGIGACIIKARTEGVKLLWNSNMESSKLTKEQAAEFDFGATLFYNDEVVDQSNVVINFTGTTKKWRIYSSSKAPTEAGSYVVTVTPLGGNYISAPISRTFSIN